MSDKELVERLRELEMDMRKHCARLDSIGGGHAAQPVREFADRLFDETREAATKIESLSEDAGRYRWLREFRMPPEGETQPAAWAVGRGNKHIESELLTGSWLDTAIDQAMSQEAGSHE